jgi:hypothetical protein
MLNDFAHACNNIQLTSIKNKVGQLLRNSYKKKVSQIIGEI